MDWMQISVTVDSAAHDAVIEMFQRVGCSGAWTLKDTVTAYLPVLPESDGKLESVKKELAQLPDFGLPAVQQISTAIVKEQDWAESWKDYFHPQRIGKRLVICPSWREFAAEPGDVVVLMDPGMAFGTGQHPTTQLCAEWLEELVSAGSTVVDVGTGSGILAIWAAKLGASQVWAGDVDAVAGEVANENVRINAVQQNVSVHVASGLADAPVCDLLVANIIADVILPMLPEFTSRIKSGGRILLSGIVDFRADEIVAAMKQSGFEQFEVRANGEWRAFSGVRGI